MNLNADLIRARCTEIEESVRRLERFKALSRHDFLSNQDTLDVACYRLLVAIEAALALCFHVSAKRFHQAPEEYAGCFEVLREGGIVSTELCHRLQQMAGFRNLLVHMYWKLDYGQVHDAICHNLEDLRSFAASISRLL